MYGNKRFNNHGGPPRKSWRPIERRVSGNVVVEVNELPLSVPKYSFKVGSVVTDDSGQILEVKPYLNIYNVSDAVRLLGEMSEKYLSLREDKQREYDERSGNKDSDFPEDVPPKTFRRHRR